jgi:hypothetical protein
MAPRRSCALVEYIPDLLDLEDGLSVAPGMQSYRSVLNQEGGYRKKRIPNVLGFLEVLQSDFIWVIL